MFLGLLGAAAAGGVLVGGLWLFGAAADRLGQDGAKKAVRLIVSGAEISNLRGSDLWIRGRGMSLRLICRGVCDDLRIEPAMGAPAVRLLDSSGACVMCANTARWKVSASGDAVLARRKAADAGERR